MVKIAPFSKIWTQIYSTSTFPNLVADLHSQLVPKGHSKTEGFYVLPLNQQMLDLKKHWKNVKKSLLTILAWFSSDCHRFNRSSHVIFCILMYSIGTNQDASRISGKSYVVELLRSTLWTPKNGQNAKFHTKSSEMTTFHLEWLLTWVSTLVLRIHISTNSHIAGE